MSEDSLILQLKNVNKEFGAGTIDEVKALDNINLEAHNSDFITVIGSNGAGKTTLLNVIAGVYPPGMKLVATWCKADRGMGIGLLIGALTLGSAMPHLLNALEGKARVLAVIYSE